MSLLGSSYVRWHIPIHIFPLLKFSFTPIKGEHGPWCLLAIPVTVVQPGFVNGGQSEGAKQPSGGGGGEGVGRGFTPFHRREIFFGENSCMKTKFLAHWMSLLGGWLYEVTYTNPYSPFFFIILLQSRGRGGGGAWALVPLAMPVTVVQPGFVNGVPKRGSEATELGEGVGGGFPLPR